jgi:CDGSH-type Zn-finger protein
MLTRRELLALIGSAAVAKIVRADEVPYPRIEGHFHIPKVVPEVFSKLEETNWRALTICVCGPLGNDPFDLDGLHRRAAEVFRESKGRVDEAHRGRRGRCQEARTRK